MSTKTCQPGRIYKNKDYVGQDLQYEQEIKAQQTRYKTPVEEKKTNESLQILHQLLT